MRHRVSEMLRKKGVVVCTTENASVTEAVREMATQRVGSVLVLDSEERLAGIFTERDLLERVVAEQLDPKTTRIADVMTRDVLIVSATTPRHEVLQIMNSRHIRHVPVSDGEHLLGVISLRDVLRFENAEKEFEIEQLRQYVLQEPSIMAPPRGPQA